MQIRRLFAILITATACQAAYAACNNCGSVTDIKTVQVKGEGTGLGVVAGGVLGGVLGNQVGGGRGKDIATVAGVAGGAYAGHQVEKNARSKTSHQVIVQLQSGNSRTFSYGSATGFKVGDRVKVVGNKLVRD